MKKYPLSQTEYGIYLEHISQPDSLAYNIPVKVCLRADTDTRRLSSAIETVLKKHPYLNSAFDVDSDGNVYKYIKYEVPSVEVIKHNSDDLSPYIRYFDLKNDRLYRVYLLCGPKEVILFMDFHHIIFDGTSYDILLDEINKAYCGQTLSEEECTANDFALLEKEKLESEDYITAKHYYIQRFDGVEAETEIFHDKNEGQVQQAETEYCFEYVDAETVKNFAHQNHIRSSTVFNSAFSFVMSKYTNAESVLYSTIHNGRNPKLNHTLGMFVKTIPFYADFSVQDRVSDFLNEMNQQMTDNRKYDLYSYMNFVQDTKLNPSILFAYQGDLFVIPEFCGQAVRPTEMPLPNLKENLAITLYRYQGKFIAHAAYRADLYDETIIHGMIQSLDKTVSEFMKKEHLADVDMLTKQAEQRLDSFNEKKDFFEIGDVVTLVRNACEKYPNHTAVVFNDVRYTYAQLDDISERLAIYLRSQGIGREDVVSVLIPRCEYIVLASIGVLKSGAAYQPLDASYPTERLEFMIRDSGAKLLIADRNLMSLVPNYHGDVLYLEDIPNLPKGEKIQDTPNPNDKFIMLYTSGSTGVPKGVMLEHHNIVAYCMNNLKVLKMDSNSKLANYASYGFDASMGDMYPALSVGAEIHIIDESIRLDLIALKQYFDENKITHLLATTQVGRQFVELFPHSDSLQVVAVGGEKLVPVQPPENYTLLNLYGPTECTVFTNYFPVDKLYERVPIGESLFDVKEYVVDKYGRRLPVGAPGELWIAGPQVSRGYLNRPEQNEKAFIDNPFDKSEYFDRVYRTGDIVRWLSDGKIDFVGRNDGQVKIRGFRIELTEVEAIIRQFDAVKDATVQAFDEASGGKYIVAYIVADTEIDIDALNRFIAENKPPYMVPAVTMQIDRIPLTQNQKVNKRALPVPERKAEKAVPPQTDMQKKIFECVQEVIGNSSFGVTTDIFEAGLTSIGSIKLNVLLSKAFDTVMGIHNLKENRTILQLEQFLQNAVGTPNTHYELQSDYPITQTQNGIFVECTANMGSTIYNIPMLMKLSDKVDISKLKLAVEKAINAHPYLKVKLSLNENGDIRAHRNDEEQPCVEVLKVAELPPSSKLVLPYQLLNHQLYRIQIFCTPTQNYLFLDCHHIVCDGTSLAVLLEDINHAYSGAALTAESYTGYELALDEEKMRSSRQYDEAKQYYDRVFKGCDNEFLPPKDKKVNAFASNLFERNSNLSLEEIRTYCEENGITLNAFFTTVFGFVLSKYCCKEESVFTTIYNGRSDSRLMRSVTMLVKTLPVYCQFNGDSNILEQIKATGTQLMDSMSNDIYSFAEISRAYGIKADVLFAYQGDNFEFDSIGGEPAENMVLELNTPKAPISIDVVIKNNQFVYSCDYRTDMYLQQTIANFTACMDEAAKSFMTVQTFKQVSILDENSKALIEQWNDTDTERDTSTCNQLLETQVRRHPDKIAVIAGEEKLTYSELNAYANRIAHSLMELGISADDMVGVMMPRTVFAYTARQGVIKAGGAFMPIDYKYPDDRIAYIFEDSKSKTVITTEELAFKRKSLFKGMGVRVLTVEKLFECENTDNPTPKITPQNLCYCIYTSGSTGKPKGVMIEHHSLVNFIHQYAINVQPDENGNNDTVMLALAALTFDVSVLEESISLYNGGTAAIATEDEINNPILLAEMLIRNGVNATSITPSYVNNMIDVPIVQQALRQFKAIDVGAENFPAPLYDKMREVGITAHIYNGYGPTEATVASIIDRLDSNYITIGTPIGNTKAYIIDPYRHILPVGVVGELVIVGECVGRGYVGKSELTKDKFITLNGLPAYRSGDLASWGTDGKIHFIGRMDNQVKLRGLRVELDEIENVMNQYPSVVRSVVLVKENEKSGQFLCGYFTASEEVDKDKLTEHLKKSLTHYMVPSVLIQLEALPLTNNGKVDKKSLPEPQFEEKSRNYKQPTNDLQKHLCEMLASVLNLNAIGIDEDFFELGGTSLSASKVAMRAMVENIPIAFKDIFDNPTVEQLEKHILSVQSADAPVAQTEPSRETQQLSALKYNTVEYVKEIQACPMGNVLLTGSTGFLGIHVLRELLQHTDSKIYCLLRQTKSSSGTALSNQSRLKSMLMYYFDDPMEELFDKRIFVVEGDITDQEKVLSLEQYDFDTVINCAACVKHFANDEILDEINHKGVDNIIDLCVKTDRRLVQISTVSVAGTSTLSKMSADTKIRENELDIGQNLDNKYIFTKFMAEKDILTAIENRHLRAKIVRVGNLMSRYSDGEFQINSQTNGFMSTLRAYAMIGKISVSELDAVVEFSPIDCTALAVVRLASSDDRFTVFHAVNSHFVQMGDVVEAMNRSDTPIEIVDDDVFAEAFHSALTNEKTNANVSPLISYLSSDNQEAEFYIDNDSTFTTKALYRLGFKWPIINENYIQNTITALASLGYFTEE